MNFADPNINSNPLDDMMAGFLDNLGGLKGNDLAAYEDLDFYSRYVMDADNQLPPNSKFLTRIYNELQYSEDQDFLILGPRQSAKSTAITVTYTTWKIGRNPLIRFMIAVASIEMQGQAFGRQIDQILTKNERYMKIFGHLKPEQPDKWTEREKIVRRKEPPGGMKDPTISIVGIGSAVPSRRADEIITDDVVTQDNAYSQKERASLRNFVLQSLFPIRVPGGRRIIVGSRWDPRDLYYEIADLWGLEFPSTDDIDLGALRELVAS